MNKFKKHFFRELNARVKLFNKIKWIDEDSKEKHDYSVGLIGKLLIIRIFDCLGVKEFYNIYKSWCSFKGII